MLFRITDKKERNTEVRPNPAKLKQTNSAPKPPTPVAVKRPVPIPDPIIPTQSNPVERMRTLSESSSASSRKSSVSTPPMSVSSEEKPEKSVKNNNNSSSESPPLRQRNKKKSQHNNDNKKSKQVETSEPVIVTEEIRDPWERDLIEKFRTDQQKKEAKIVQQASNDDEKQSKKKSKNSKKELQKENSSGSTPDEDDMEDKSDGFHVVESKSSSKTKKQKPEAPSALFNGTGGTMDKLDEISLSGPKPDIATQKYGKNESKAKAPAKKRISSPDSFQRYEDKYVANTPTSPHALAAATVEAAVVKSMQNKKKKGKIEKSLSAGNNGPVSPQSLSDGSRSSSYSSIVSEVTKEGGRSSTPSGLLTGK